ncbi:MAG: DNA polymerase III subunit delta [Proteobacteria bacterium]|nr:DNA polymerase III subunit delta [Pseudomonadota bacterium]MBU1687395.1 DNA polymerase III subunit delta [Pseudomonadota bacterium]
MTLYSRKDLDGFWKKLAASETCPVYLIFGERFLTSQTVTTLLERLLPEAQSGTANLIPIDGDQEQPVKTLNQLRTYSLFGGKQIFKVTDSKLFHSKNIAKTLWTKALGHYDSKEGEEAGRTLKQFLEVGGIGLDDLDNLSAAAWKARFGFTKPSGSLAWVSEVLEAPPEKTQPTAAGGPEEAADLYLQAFEAGIPSGNILILTAETVDKRKKLYKYITQHGTVIDLSVDTGSSKAASDAQQDILRQVVRERLQEFACRIEPRALDLLLERVGFHPVAAALESEKLALLVGEGQTIKVADLNEVVGRTREEALYELSEAFSNRNLGSAMTISGRLLENGVYPLVILATLRNHIKKLLVIRSLQNLSEPTYSESLGFPAFKDRYLERLKQTLPQVPSELGSHPYALFMLFRMARNFTCSELIADLKEILTAEYRSKGSGLPPPVIMDTLFLKILGGERLRR